MAAQTSVRILPSEFVKCTPEWNQLSLNVATQPPSGPRNFHSGVAITI
jgi:hypothetical protein